MCFSDCTVRLLFFFTQVFVTEFWLNPLMPNDSYRGRTAPLTSKVAFYIFIQQI